MKRFLYRCVVCLAAVLLVPVAGLAATATVSGDTYISQTSAANTFGATGTMNVSSANSAVIQFDLAALQALGLTNAGIQKAYLSVFVNRVLVAGGLDFALTNQSWSELSATYNNFNQGLIGAPFASNILVQQSGVWVKIDVTNQVRDWLTGVVANNGIIVKAAVAQPATSAVLDSKESTTTSAPAFLDILLSGSGATGPSGPQGPGGPAGATGASGPAGGPTGASGPAGPAGSTGASGPAGAVGPSGASGPAGAVGSSGASGPAGAVGSTGASGPAGAVGSTGASGPAGTVGPSGASGPAGPAGSTGASGPAGPGGSTGASGPAGPGGSTGASGPAGAVGPSGASGPAGPGGSTGASGPAGAVGPSGASGPAGPGGSAGASGPAGPAGPSGPQGAPGGAGPAGATGASGTAAAQQFNSAVGTLSTTGAYSWSLNSSAAFAATTLAETLVEGPVSAACTFDRMDVRLVTGTAPPAPYNVTVELIKGGVPSGIKCSVSLSTGSSATSCSDTTHTLVAAAGDTLALQATTAPGVSFNSGRIAVSLHCK